MKLLFFTDTHVRATNPRSRLDDYYHTSIKKFEEIRDYANSMGVDYVIHGGDLFDRPDTAIKPTSDIGKILASFKMPIYIVSGNHDIYGYNIDTVNRSMLGLLDSVGILNMIPEDGVLLKDDGLSVLLLGVPYSTYIDSDKENYIVKKTELKYKADYIINIVHGFLTDRKFIENVPHTLVHEIYETDADLTLTGHYHSGYPTHYHEGKIFANPGSLLRISGADVGRKPKFLEINISNEKIEVLEKYLKCALPSDQIFDKTAKEEDQFKKERLLHFSDTVDQNIDLERLNLEDIITSIAISENFDEKIRNEAKKRLDIAKELYNDFNH